jgi:hypothetical protein
MQPDAASPTRNDSLEAVMADLVRDFDDPEGTDARDMAVWKDRRILTVIRGRGEDQPEVTTFEPGG